MIIKCHTYNIVSWLFWRQRTHVSTTQYSSCRKIIMFFPDSYFIKENILNFKVYIYLVILFFFLLWDLSRCCLWYCQAFERHIYPPKDITISLVYVLILCKKKQKKKIHNIKAFIDIIHNVKCYSWSSV